MRCLSLALACLAATGLPAGAEAPTALRQAALSAALHAQGAAAGDAVTLLVAARLRKEAGLAPSDGGPDLALSWQSILAEAEAAAGGDPVVLGLIADLRADRAKGVASGPIYSLATLPAGTTTDIGDFAFRGGEYAEVYVEAPPGSDLNLSVRDAAGNLVCADVNPSNIAYCGWTPAADGVFILTVENRGSAPADYALMTN